MSWHSRISRLAPCTSRETTLDRKSLPLSPSWSIRKLGDTTDIYILMSEICYLPGYPTISYALCIVMIFLCNFCIAVCLPCFYVLEHRYALSFSLKSSSKRTPPGSPTGPYGESRPLTKRGIAMANYPQELARDAVCQSHTGHMTGLRFLPARPLRLNTNE